MDANKLTVLREVKYRMGPACGLCTHAKFPQNDWGTCALHTYEHGKHGTVRRLSIHKMGSCPNFDAVDETAFLGGFTEFLEKR